MLDIFITGCRDHSSTSIIEKKGVTYLVPRNTYPHLARVRTKYLNGSQAYKVVLEICWR